MTNKYTFILSLTLIACGSPSEGDKAQDPTTGGMGSTTSLVTSGSSSVLTTTGGADPTTGGSKSHPEVTGGSPSIATTTPCNQGTLQCPCYASGLCSGGLTCSNNICTGTVVQGTGGSSSTGGAKSTGGRSSILGTGGSSTTTGSGTSTGGSKSTGGSSSTSLCHPGDPGCSCANLPTGNNQCYSSNGYVFQCITSLPAGPRCWATNYTDPTRSGQAGFLCQTTCAIGQTPPCNYCGTGLTCDSDTVCEAL